MIASSTAPPVAPPKYRMPRFWASCGAAVLPALSCAMIALLPTRAAAPKPRASVNR
jgi:hypothetical protein